MYLLSCLTFSLYAISSWARGLGAGFDEGFIGVFNDGTELPGEGTLPIKHNNLIKIKIECNYLSNKYIYNM